MGRVQDVIQVQFLLVDERCWPFAFVAEVVLKLGLVELLVGCIRVLGSRIGGGFFFSQFLFSFTFKGFRFLDSLS